MNLVTFKAVCSSCKQMFATPVLPDAAYGMFLYYSTDGQRVRFFEALDHPVWKQVERVIQQLSVPGTGETIRPMVGQLADAPSKGEYFITDIICPRCSSTVQQVTLNKKAGSQHIKRLSFQYFNTLNEIQKKRRIQTILTDIL